MHAIHPDTEFRDDETGRTPPWSRADPAHGPGSFVHPPQARPERRQVSLRPSGPPAHSEAQASGLTPTQWLAQWCCLDEQP